MKPRFILCLLAILLTAHYGASQDRTPGTAETFLDRGILLASNGDYEMAIADFTEALSLDENMASAYILRGRAFFAAASHITSLGENFSNVTAVIDGEEVSDEKQVLYDKAIADFTQALRLEPDSSHAYRERGVAYSDKGDQNNAIADLNQAIRLDPNNAAAYNNRGNIYRRMNDNDLAIADYSQAIRINPDFARAYTNRGVMYHAIGELNHASEDLNQAILLAPDDALAYYNRGIYYIDIDDNDRAILDFSQVIRLNFNPAAAYFYRGFAYYMNMDYDRAIADYEATLRIDPNHAYATEWLENARLAREEENE